MDETKRQSMDATEMKERLDGFVCLMDACLTHSSPESIGTACHLLYLELKKLVSPVAEVGLSVSDVLPLRKDAYRHIPWAELHTKLKNWHDKLEDKDVFRKTLQWSDISTIEAIDRELRMEGALSNQTTLADFAERKFVMTFEMVLKDLLKNISVIISAFYDNDESEKYVDYWHRELENFRLDEWDKLQTEIRRETQKVAAGPKRDKMYEARVNKIAKQLKELSSDSINTENMYLYEESLGRLLWSESNKDDGGNFEKLLLHVQSLIYYCRMINKPLTVIGVENTKNARAEEEEKLEEIEKARQNSLQCAKDVTTGCKEYIKDEYALIDLDEMWDKLLDSDLAYDIAVRLNRAAGIELIICTVIGVLLQEGVLKCKKVDVVGKIFASLHGDERWSMSDKDKRKKTYGSDMTPSKLAKEEALKEWVGNYIKDWKADKEQAET